MLLPDSPRAILSEQTINILKRKLGGGNSLPHKQLVNNQTVVAWISLFDDGADVRYDPQLLKSAAVSLDSVRKYVELNNGQVEEFTEDNGVSVLICAYYHPINGSSEPPGKFVKACLKLCCSTKMFRTKKSWASVSKPPYKDLEKGKDIYTKLVESTARIATATTQAKGKKVDIQKAANPVKTKSVVIKQSHSSVKRKARIKSTNKSPRVLKKNPVAQQTSSTAQQMYAMENQNTHSNPAVSLNRIFRLAAATLGHILKKDHDLTTLSYQCSTNLSFTACR